MHDNIILLGTYKIILKNANNGEIIKIINLKNQLTLINQTIRSQMLMGTYTGPLDALQIKYFATGTGTTAPTPNDTQLENEQFRKQVTQITNPNSSTVQSVVSLGTAESNFVIKEIGIFCGSSASSTPNSGTLLSRVAVNIDKNSSIVMNIVRSDICTI